MKSIAVSVGRECAADGFYVRYGTLGVNFGMVDFKTLTFDLSGWPKAARCNAGLDSYFGGQGALSFDTIQQFSDEGCRLIVLCSDCYSVVRLVQNTVESVDKTRVRSDVLRFLAQVSLNALHRKEREPVREDPKKYPSLRTVPDLAEIGISNVEPILLVFTGGNARRQDVCIASVAKEA